MLKQSLEDQLAQDNKALEKANTDNAEFASSLEAEKADLAEAQKSLASLEAAQAAAKSNLWTCGLGSRGLRGIFRERVEGLGRSNAGSPE